MTLVERFIEFDQWPAGRKTLLLLAVALPSQTIVSLITYFAIAPTGLFKDSWLPWILAAGPMIQVFCLLATYVAVRRGQDGSWTAHLLIILFSLWILVFLGMLGVWVTPLLAWAPVAVMLMGLWYGERIGWFAFIYSTLLAVVLIVATLLGLVPLAPGMTDRSIDAQISSRWVIGIFAQFVGFYVHAFGLSILTASARQLQAARIKEAHTKLERSSGLIRRYVPAQVAEAILAGHNEVVDTHARRKLTIFFSDLVEFTDISERMEPEDLSRVLNEYFTSMTAIAQRYDGTVDELSGDAILIFFGAPKSTNDKDHALRAVRMSVDMQSAVQALNAKWQTMGIDVVFKVRMGINTGIATIGNFGSEGRTKYAALGRSVNLAARIQSKCEPTKILLSRATWLLVKDEVSCREVATLQLKGIPAPVAVYEPAIVDQPDIAVDEAALPSNALGS